MLLLRLEPTPSLFLAHRNDDKYPLVHMSTSSPSTVSPPVALVRPAQRMFEVTGFVSVLTEPGDERTRVFSRYFHVRRVAWLSILLDALHPDGRGDQDALNWFAWAHDLNRWPFAHNSERGVFDQAADLPRYLSAESIEASKLRIEQLMAIVDKKPGCLGREASTVLLADIVTGFLEDPIWLLAALNVSPSVVPSAVASYLGFPLHDRNFLNRMLALLQNFRPGLDPNEFVKAFDWVFANLAQSFVEDRLLTAGTCNADKVLSSSDFKRHWDLVKEGFMRSVIFPYNNEKISRGSVIKSEVILPLLDRLGDEPAVWLTRATDASLVREAIEQLLLDQAALARIRPDLDYMQRAEPENSFAEYMSASTWD